MVDVRGNSTELTEYNFPSVILLDAVWINTLLRGQLWIKERRWNPELVVLIERHQIYSHSLAIIQHITRKPIESHIRLSDGVLSDI